MKTIVALLILLAISGAAYADNESGLYAGAGVGWYNVKIDSVEELGTTLQGIEFDSDDVSYKAFAGWRFGKWVGVEVDYLYLGEPEDDVSGVPVTTKLHGVAPYIVGTLPLGPIELSAKVGYLFYDFEVEAQNFARNKTSDEDPVYGVGIGLTLFERVAAKLEYERIDISRLDTSDALWLTGAWRF